MATLVAIHRLLSSYRILTAHRSHGGRKTGDIVAGDEGLSSVFSEAVFRKRMALGPMRIALVVELVLAIGR